MQPLVSIVMAAYNGARFIRPQLDSLLAQAYDNLEIVIVDDCSTDDTRSICEEYLLRDARIRLIALAENRGAVHAFETGLAAARGDYIALCDQDDIFDPQKISAMVAALQANPGYGMVFSDLRLISEDGSVIAESMWRFQKMRQKQGRPFRQLIYTNFVTGCASLFTRELLSAALPFPRDCIIHDWWLSVVAASQRGGGILLLPRPLVSYRQHGVNVIGAHSGGVATALKRAPDLEQRTRWYQRNVARIEGYLTRDIWTRGELAELHAVREVFSGYAADSERGLLSRVKALPDRFSYSLTQNFSHALGTTLFTLFPPIVEVARTLAPAAGIGEQRKGR